MYIKRVEIDGFKSYAQKQSVGEFDSQFNAITGLNGTGKSNILDSICFVLGITNLSCIRAGQMNDLVYKMGQAGINKATVTITFDNSDKKQSPLGYQAYSEIIVRRQVIVNGRNTYTINGTAMPQNKVADFFRGVGLNVNNPHFLIMQGRITKVLNMKPGEILGMLEEAAGTKMYDAKRDLAVGLIAKKDIKLGEIEATLNKDILPTVERLKQDRANYLEWQRCDRDIAQKERKLIAFIFYQSGVESKKANERAAEMEEKLAASDELDTEFKNLVVEMEEQYKEMEDLRDGQNKGERSALDDRAKIANNELAKLESEYDAIKADQKKQENELKRLEKAVAQDSKELQGKRTELTKLEKDKGGEEQKGEEAKERVEKARTHLAAVLQGMTTDSEGKAITIETQINQAKEQLEQLTAEVKNAQTREKQICSQLDDKRRQLAELTRRADSEESELDKLTAERQRVERDMKGVVFDKTRFETVSNRARDVGREKQEADGRLRDTLARNNNIHFQYNRNVLPASFDERTVYGCAVRHIRPIDKKFNTAVEVTSGSQLYQVIVADAGVAKTLIDTRGCLSQRTTFIPLDKIQPRAIDKQRIQAAKQIAAKRGESCWGALEVIEFDNTVARAMQFIFGSTIICESKETASAITFDERVKARTVTLEGDSYQPSGSGSGGSREKKASVLDVAIAVSDLERSLRDKSNALADVEEELRQMEPHRQRFEQARHRLQELNERLRVLDENARHNPVNMLRDEVADFEKELPTLAAHIKEKQSSVKELVDQVKTFEDRKRNAKQFKEQEEKKAKKELKDAETALNALGEEVERSKELLSTRREEIAALEKQIAEQQQQISDLQANGVAAVEALKNKETVLAEAQERVKDMQGIVDEFRGKMRKQDEEMKKMAARIDKTKKQMLNEEAKRADYRATMEEALKEARDFQKQHADTLRKYAWIKDEEEQFGKAGTEYEFEKGYSYEVGQREVTELKERKEDLGRKLNTKAMNILGTAEEKVMSLLKRKETLDTDKATILETIRQLDEKKKEEVHKAYEQVTRDFGQIFSMLLPGADAKLRPLPGKSPLDGLEVKVGFNGKWKESLGELSGGQRSLVALSLVLAMLKFKPAPLYILDEVDAALDLSHTQNIGAMIKKHFTNSQFIIVSLKEGMFNNANVLFRTRFQDGTSQVQRFAN